MSTPTDLLMTGWRQNGQQVDRLLRDIQPELMTRQPGGVVNHPAWTLAHLIHYHPAILALLRGQPVPDPAEAPDASRYDAGSTPADDPELYPSRHALLKQYQANHAEALSLLETMGEDTLHQPPGLPRWAHTFGVTGRTLVYLMHYHEATHIGQIMVWRRAMGMPPLE